MSDTRNNTAQKNVLAGEVVSSDTGHVGELDQKTISVCEHFSSQPLVSLYCLELASGVEINVETSRRFARMVRGEPFGDPSWDNSFDLIICNHNYQVYPDFDVLAEEIYRLLTPGGFCLFTGSAGSAWTKSGPKGKYLSLSGIRKRLSNFWIHDYSDLILQFPTAFGRAAHPMPWLRHILPMRIQRIIFSRAVEFVWTLSKKK